MSDVVISGDTAVRKAPAPPPIEVEMPAPVAGPERLPDRSEGADLRLKRIGGEPIELGQDGAELNQAMRGREAPPDAHVTTDGYNQDKLAPTYAWNASLLPEAGEHESPHHQARRFSHAMSEKRKGDAAGELDSSGIFKPGAGREIVDAMLDAPPTKVGAVGDDGQNVPPLLDNQPVREIDSFANLNEAKRSMENYRRQQSLLLEMRKGEAEATPARQAQEAQQAEDARRQEQERVETARQAQASQAAIAQVQQEAAALNEIKRMSLNEAELAARIQRHDEWAAKNFPELYNANALVQMAQTNPTRLVQLQGEFQKNNTARARLAEHQQNRQLREYVVAQYQTQQATVQRAAWAEGEDAKFNQWLADTHPHFAKGDGYKKLMAAAAEIGSPDFKASYGACGPARSFDGQKGLAAEAILHLGKQKNIELASKRAPVPPVQQPGVYSPRGADNEA